MKNKDQILLESLYERILLEQKSDEEYMRLAQNPEKLQTLMDDETSLAILKKLQPERGGIPKSDRITNLFRKGISLSDDELYDLQKDYERWSKKAGITPTSLEYHVRQGNAVVWTPYGSEDKFVGQFISDVFVVSHFAPKSGKSAINSLLDLLHTNTPVAFAVPDNLAKQLQKIGFKKGNIMFPTLFRGNIVHKNLLINNSVNDEDFKKLTEWWMADSHINGVFDKIKNHKDSNSLTI